MVWSCFRTWTTCHSWWNLSTRKSRRRMSISSWPEVGFCSRASQLSYLRLQLSWGGASISTSMTTCSYLLCSYTCRSAESLNCPFNCSGGRSSSPVCCCWFIDRCSVSQAQWSVLCWSISIMLMIWAALYSPGSKMASCRSTLNAASSGISHDTWGYTLRTRQTAQSEAAEQGTNTGRFNSLVVFYL